MNRPISSERKETILKHIESGMSFTEIAKKMGVSKSAISGFARRRGVCREYHRSSEETSKIIDFLINNQDLFDDRKLLRAELSKHMGTTIQREYLNNIISKHGLSRPKTPESIKHKIGELSLDAAGGPSYSDEVDRAFLELLETEDEPPAWLLEAYEPWLKARCEWVRSQRRKEVEHV